MLIRTFCGPDYTSAGSGGVKPSVRLVAIMSVTKLAMDGRLDFWVR